MEKQTLCAVMRSLIRLLAATFAAFIGKAISVALCSLITMPLFAVLWTLLP